GDSSLNRDRAGGKRQQRSDVGDLEAKVRQLESTLAERDLYVEQLENVVGGLQSTLAERTEQVEQLEATLGGLQQTADGRVGKIQRQIEVITDLRAKLVARDAELVASVSRDILGTAEALRHPDVLNTFNFSRLGKYTHGAFLRVCESGGQFLYSLLRSALGSITGNLEGPRKESRELLLDQALGCAYAWFIQWADPQFSWEYGTLLQVALRKVSKSTFVTDTLGDVFPGTPGATTLKARLDRYTKYVMDQRYELYPSDAIHLYDNQPGFTGGYKQSSSRAGLAMKKLTTVATAQGVLHYIPQLLQGSARHSPKADKTVGSLLELGEGERYLHRIKAQAYEGDEFSELEHLEREVRGYLQQQIAIVLKQRRELAAQQQGEQQVEYEGGADPAVALPVQCAMCPCRWPERAKKCKIGSGGCGRWLKQAREEAMAGDKAPVDSLAPEHVGSYQVGSTLFNSATKRAQTPKVKDLCGTLSSFTTKKPAADTTDALSSSSELIIPGARLLSIDQEFRWEILPTIMENPNQYDNVVRVLKSIGVMSGVRGFVDTDDVKKEWTMVCADQGAISYCMHLLQDKTGIFSSLRYVLSGGHAMMSVQKVVLKILLDHGYASLAPAYGFRTPAAQQYLFSGKNPHLTNEWLLDVARPIMCQSFVSAWLDANPDLDDDEDVDDLMSFYGASTDTNFRSHCILCIEVLSAYALFHKGMRVGNRAAHAAGRKFLLPFLAVLNHGTYFKAVHKDIFDYDYACSPELRCWYYKHFVEGSLEDNKESPDFWQEDFVKDSKSMNLQDNALGFHLAAATANNVQGHRAALFGACGRAVPRTDRRRTATNFKTTLEAGLKVMARATVFQQVPDRSTVHTFRGEVELLAGTDINTLLKKGDEGCKGYIDSSYIDMPARIKLRSEMSAEQATAARSILVPPQEGDLQDDDVWGNMEGGNTDDEDDYNDLA
ncbi:hypothetical protein B484DRAFT_435498, partial [Ochromonadaceae sp. CCMP2298]